MEEQKPNAPIVPQLDSSMDELNKTVEDTQVYARKAGVVSAILYIAILAVFGVFIWSTLHTVKRNFTANKFITSIEARGSDMAPLLAHNMLSVLQKVEPVYMDEAKKTFKDFIPKFKGLSVAEAKNLLDKADKESLVLINDAMDTKNDLLKSMYPGLTPPELKVSEVANDKVWAEEGAQLSKSIIDPFGAQWTKLRATLNKFNNPALPGDEGLLYRDMAHNLLLLLDKELMEVK